MQILSLFAKEGKTCAQYGVEMCEDELVGRACRQTCASAMSSQVSLRDLSVLRCSEMHKRWRRLSASEDPHAWHGFLNRMACTCLLRIAKRLRTSLFPEHMFPVVLRHLAGGDMPAANQLWYNP